MISFLGLFHSGRACLRQFLCGGRFTGAGWTLYPPQAILPGTPGSEAGILVDAGVLGRVHHWFHDGRPELCGDDSAGQNAGYDADAHAVNGMGHFCRDDSRLVCLPGIVCECHHDVLDVFLGTSFFMPAIMTMGNEGSHVGGNPLTVSAPFLVLWPSRGLHRRAASFRHCF